MYVSLLSEEHTGTKVQLPNISLLKLWILSFNGQIIKGNYNKLTVSLRKQRRLKHSEISYLITTLRLQTKHHIQRRETRHSNRRQNRREQTDDEAIRIVSNVKGLKINNGKTIVWVHSGIIWATKRKIMAFTLLSVTLWRHTEKYRKAPCVLNVGTRWTQVMSRSHWIRGWMGSRAGVDATAKVHLPPNEFRSSRS